MDEAIPSANNLAPEKKSTGTTLAILGCGNLGTALLCGVLTSIQDRSPDTPWITTLTERSIPIPTKFIAYTRTYPSALRVEDSVSHFDTHVSIHHGCNPVDLINADIIVLGCQPADLATCLGNATIKKALQGKLLISLLAGVLIPDIEAILQPPGDNCKAATIVRAMPNTASFVRESMTVIEAPVGTSVQVSRMVTWLFESIGTVKHIKAANFDTCTALCASTPAFFAVILEALVDGAVSLGLNRDDGETMAAQAMKGAAELVLSGERPSVVKDKICTPGGSTIVGLLKLEQGNMRAVVAGALIHCKTAAEGLGG